MVAIKIRQRLSPRGAMRKIRQSFVGQSGACVILCASMTNLALDCGEEISVGKIPLATLKGGAMFAREYSSRFVCEARRIG
jgi:hypothetical protein